MIQSQCWNAVVLGLYESLRLAVFWGNQSVLPLARSMKATIRAWATSQHFMQHFMQPDF